MNLAFNKSKKVFLSTNLEVKTSGNIDLILSPEFYWVRVFSIPVKNVNDAKKVLPSLFEDVLESLDGLDFEAIKIDKEKFLCFAYDNKKIYGTIKKLNIPVSTIKSIYFAQTEFEKFDTFKVDNKSYMYTAEKILVRVPSSLIKNPTDLNDKLDDLYLSKHKININLYKSILSRKNIYILIALISILICVNVFKLISYKKENTYLTNNTFKIKEENSLPSSMIKTTSIISEYEKRILIENRKRELISYLISNRKFKVRSLELNNRSILVSYYSTEKKDLEKYISNAYKVLSSQVRGENLYVRVEI